MPQVRGNFQDVDADRSRRSGRLPLSGFVGSPVLSNPLIEEMKEDNWKSLRESPL